MPHARPTPAQRRAAARIAAQEYDGVLSRRLLRGLGIDRDNIAREVAAERWYLWGHQSVAVHRAPLSALARTWRAVWEVGERHALLDGASALIAAGMTGFAVDREHVSIVHRSRVAPVEGVQIHKLIRRVPDEAATVGVPHVRPALACVRAAHWAVSDRQAALLLVMPVQQRLVTGAQLLEAVALNPGRNRRALIARLVGDIADGSHSLGELDVVAALRRRGLPEPSRQVLRRGPQGVVYLDICFDEVNLVVEVDGAGHWQGLAQATDDLRQNEVSIGGRTVLRVSLIGWRLNPEAYIEQIARAYWSRR